jgi:hypothetical protein
VVPLDSLRSLGTPLDWSRVKTSACHERGLVDGAAESSGAEARESVAHPMSKPAVLEIPTNATDEVVRIQLEAIHEVIRDGRSVKKDRVRVTIQQGE